MLLCEKCSSVSECLKCSGDSILSKKNNPAQDVCACNLTKIKEDNKACISCSNDNKLCNRCEKDFVLDENFKCIPCNLTI